MKRYNIFSLIFFSVMVVGAVANAQFWEPAPVKDTIRLGEPGYNGTGCPIGSVATVLSDDRSALSILLSEFVAQAGRASTGATTAAKNCTIGIPVHVPQGLSFSLVGVDYRGLLSLPAGGVARLSAEYFLQGPGQPPSRGPRMARMFRGPTFTDYLVENDLILTGQIWSACGKDVILRVNASMMVNSNYRGEDVLATVDSMDVSAGILYHLQTRSCR